MRAISMLFLSMFFWGCNFQSEIVPVKLQAEELEVIKQTFPDFDFPAWRLIKTPQLSSQKVNQLKPQIGFVTDTLFNPVSFPSGNEYRRDLRIKLDTVFFDLQKNYSPRCTLNKQ
ncbi:MAG: hypothetical protein EOP43_07830 [Sphingobacteriaceae bacterium]|nr:MAG: hypothetical protein EOP43_07830 [Sphingobacteriaceae bacterium]